MRAWTLLVEGLFYLCESHRLSFSDSIINTKACKKIIASISLQPTSMVCGSSQQGDKAYLTYTNLPIGLLGFCVYTFFS